MAAVIKEAVVGLQFIARLGATRSSNFISVMNPFGRRTAAAGRAKPLGQIVQDDLDVWLSMPHKLSKLDCQTITLGGVAIIVTTEAMAA